VLLEELADARANISKVGTAEVDHELSSLRFFIDAIERHTEHHLEMSQGVPQSVVLDQVIELSLEDASPNPHWQREAWHACDEVKHHIKLDMQLFEVLLDFNSMTQQLLDVRRLFLDQRCLLLDVRRLFLDHRVLFIELGCLLLNFINQ
jgi:hypothetical protein